MKKDYELSNISYTNKDFFDVYPELLQLAKRLSAKWDPTVSNESDPGVVLIKELALITDKINYIADKYALENNPRSVTQIENARQLYNLLGYYPEWYESAKVNVSLYWNGEKESNKYVKIPKYTAVQDADGEFIYTLLSDVTLPLDGTYASGEIEAIEGTYNRLVVNNSDIITLSMLSDDQRIYINDYNVATNGIFVTDVTGTIPWTQVKNINIVESYTRSYSFNVDQVTGQCYLQFPRDIAYLIGDGLIVNYIISKGKEGNIPINHLTKLTNPKIATVDLDGNDVSIDSENIVITNTGNTVRGKDPVGIDEMYENWKHIAGTFDTLVTLRDYCNAVRRYPDLASNGFVTDRTNDVQLSYKVMQGTAELPTTKTKIEKYPVDSLYDPNKDYNGDGEPDESDHAWYTGQFVNTMYSNKITPYDLKLYCLKAFPYDSITNYDDYNSTFELYSDIDVNITDSDTKKMIDALNTFKCISHDFYLPEQGKICFLKNKYDINLQILANQDLTSLQAIEVKRNICKAIYNQFNSSKVEFGEGINYDDLLECIKNSDNRIKTAVLDRLTYDTYAVFHIDNPKMNWLEVPVSDDAYNEFINNPDSLFKVWYKDGYTEYKPMWKDEWKRNIAESYCKQFRQEIVAKNILAGITPYIVDVGGGYPYSFNNKKIVDTTADHVQTNLLIEMKFDQDHNVCEIELGDNEVIQFSSPNLLDKRTYGAYVYYEYIGRNLEAATDYTLGSDECIAFFYKEADKDTKYRVDLYGPGTIINSSSAIQENDRGIISTVFGNRRPSEPGEYLVGYKTLASTRQYFALSVNDNITIKKINQVRLPKEGDSEAYIYFVTKDKANDKYQFIFKDGKRILDEGEFFIYTNGSKTSLDILGAGTEIRWVGNSEPVTLECKYTDVTNIALYGSTALKGLWLTIKDPTILFVVEKSFTNALSGDIVKFNLAGDFEPTNMILDSSGIKSNEDTFTYLLDIYKKTVDGGEPIPGAKAEAATPTQGTVSDNLLDFIENMYNKQVRSMSENNELVKLDCVALRTVGEDDVDWNNLYAWKSEDKNNPGSYHYIYDYRSYRDLFCKLVDDEYVFDFDKYDHYKELLGIESGDSVAGVGTLTTIGDIRNGDVAGLQDDDDETVHDDTTQEEYYYTEEERKAFESWDSLWHNLKYPNGAYLQDFIVYGDLSESQIETAQISLEYTHTLADQQIPMSSFDKVYINDTEIPLSPSKGIETDIHAFLNLDLGPDKPQQLRYVDTPTYTLVDQVTFIEDNNVKDSVNVIEPYKQVTLYSDVNVYAQGSADPIDVRYYDEHLEKRNPEFYAHEKVDAVSSDGVLLFTEQGTNHFIAFDKSTSGTNKNIFTDKVALPEGRYILNVSHSNSCLNSLKLSYGSQNLIILGTEDSDNIADPGSYHMTFESDGSEVYFTYTYSLKNASAVEASLENGISGVGTDYKYGDVWRISNDIPADLNREYIPSGISANDYVICTRDCMGEFSWADWAVTPYPLYDLAISPLEKFEYAQETVVDPTDDYYRNIDGLYDKIKELDYDNEFNYLYKIPQNKLIKNPLKATSFLNKNHVYNQFTICEAELPDILV